MGMLFAKVVSFVALAKEGSPENWLKNNSEIAKTLFSDHLFDYFLNDVMCGVPKQAPMFRLRGVLI
jgi:hypothetical protein